MCGFEALFVQGKARSCSHGSGAYGLPTLLAGVHLAVDQRFPFAAIGPGLHWT